MARNGKTQRMSDPETVKLPRSDRQTLQGKQATLKRTRFVEPSKARNEEKAPTSRPTKGGKGGRSNQMTGKREGNNDLSSVNKKGGKGKTIAVVVTIILLVCALCLSLAWGLGLFNKQEAPQQATTEDIAVPDTVSTPESSGDGSDVAYTRYATGDVSLEYPSSWSVMTYEGAQTVVVTRGTVADGYIKIASTTVSSYGSASVADTSTMRSFVSAVVRSEQLEVDTADLSIGQRGALWVATVPMIGDISDKDAKGVQMIAASGDEAYIITALCPTGTYIQNWPYFQHVLDSISFDASSKFPNEGRD